MAGFCVESVELSAPERHRRFVEVAREAGASENAS